MDYLRFWYQALASPLGVRVNSPNVERAKQRLYKARKESRDEALMSLSIVQSPHNPNELWIIKSDKA